MDKVGIHGEMWSEVRNSHSRRVYLILTQPERGSGSWGTYLFPMVYKNSCFTNSGSYFMLQVLCLSTLGIFPIVSRGNPCEGKCCKMLCVDLQVIG